jgi:hypothetical protein
LPAPPSTPETPRSYRGSCDELRERFDVCDLSKELELFSCRPLWWRRESDIPGTREELEDNGDVRGSYEWLEDEVGARVPCDEFEGVGDAHASCEERIVALVQELFGGGGACECRGCGYEGRTIPGIKGEPRQVSQEECRKKG